MPYIGKAPSSGIRSRFIYTATAAQTTFTGADGTGKTLGYTDGEYVDVYLNGVLLDPADYTATSKTSVVLDSGATVSDIVEIVVYDTFSVFNGTFTGDLTVDGDTLVVDSTNNRVGIGTTSPSNKLDILSSGAVVARFKRDNTGSASGGISVGNNDKLFTFYVDNAGGLQIYDDATERMRIDSSGNVGIGTSPSVKLDIDNGSLKVNRGNSSGDIAVFRGLNAEKVKIDTDGIKFNGDSAAANALDDYEEGYYTPTISATSGSYTLNSSYDRASYVKIGNICHVQGQIVISANNSATGTVSLSLPFTATAGEDLAGRGMNASLIFANGSGRPDGNGYYTSAVFVGANTASANIWARPASGTFDTTIGDWLDNGSDIFLQITYRTA